MRVFIIMDIIRFLNETFQINQMSVSQEAKYIRLLKKRYRNFI